MEINKTQEASVNILGIEEKTTGSGKKFYMFDTSIGKMSCWDKAIVEDAKKLTEKDLIVVEYVEKDGFKNMKTLGPVIPNEHIGADTPTIQTTIAKPYEKDPVGLAVDIFVALRSDNSGTIENSILMKQAIELVKQAKAAFE